MSDPTGREVPQPDPHLPTVRLRTGYSFRAAIGSIDECIERVSHCKAAPITDRASAFGWDKWRRACEAAEIAPALGIELGVSPDPTAKRPLIDHWTFFPEGPGGLRAINALVETATEQYRYEPLLTYEQALRAEGVIRILGARARSTVIADLGHQEETTYFALAPGMTPGQIQRLRDAGLRPAAASDNSYPAPGQQGRYEVVCGRNASTSVWPQHILWPAEWAGHMELLGIDQRTQDEAVVNACTILAEGGVREPPTVRLPEPPDDKDLREMCQENAHRLGIDLTPEYRERLTHELQQIEDRGFSAYFHIVHDICKWARERMIVGPGRGSSCGSLVCHLLGITLLDPIKHGLLFERFIDPGRTDLPDIDIDFPDDRRAEVIEYIAETYGRENVAKLASTVNFGARSALSETAKAMEIPHFEIEKVIANIQEAASGDARAERTIEDAFESTKAGKEALEKFPGLRTAAALEGRPRHAGQHASGIVLSSEPIRDIRPVDARTGAVMMDMHDAEAAGLLKIDILGLTQLASIDETLKAIGRSAEWLNDQPLDIPEAYKVLNERRFAGVFQFSGEAVRGLASEITFESFEDLIAVPALARPGPLASGNAARWLARRRDPAQIAYGHTLLEPFTAATLGIVVYQEQVMNIAREIGGLADTEVTGLRKTMGKTQGSEAFDRYGEKWIKAAIKKGMPEPTAKREWQELCNFGQYGFNKSHAAAYATISYWCCMLKGKHPLEFAAATLNHEPDMEKARHILRELWNSGYRYKPIDPEASTDRWTVKGKGFDQLLIGPLSLARSVGPKTVEAILGSRARGERLPEKTMAKLVDAKTPLDSLWPIHDARLRICPDLAERNIKSEPREINKILKEGATDEEVIVIAVPEDLKLRNENEPSRIARRGNRIDDGQGTAFTALKLRDDTGSIAAKIPRWKHDPIGLEMLDRNRPGNALYAIKAKVLKIEDHTMLMVDRVRYLGDVEHG